MIKENIKNSLENCCDLTNKIMELSVELNNEMAKAIGYYSEDPEAFVDLLMEDEEAQEMNTYMESRELFVFGVIEVVNAFSEKVLKN